MFKFFKSRSARQADLENLKAVIDDKITNKAAEEAAHYLRSILYETPAMVKLLQTYHSTAAEPYLNILSRKEDIKSDYPTEAEKIHKAALRFIRNVQIRLIFHR